MSAQILKFPERHATQPAQGQGTAAILQSVHSEYDCRMLDLVRHHADRSLDVTKIDANMLGSFLHEGLKLGVPFTVGGKQMRLTFQIEDLTPPKSYA